MSLSMTHNFHVDDDKLGVRLQAYLGLKKTVEEEKPDIEITIPGVQPFYVNYETLKTLGEMIPVFIKGEF